MSSLNDILVKKRADDAALAAVQPKILTGAEGSVSAPPVTTPDPTPSAEVAASLAKQYEGYPEGSYLMLRQKFLILASGAKVKPDDNGVITPENDEQTKLLAYLLKQDRSLVALLSSKE